MTTDRRMRASDQDRDGRPGTVLCDSADYPALPVRAGDSPYIYRDTIFIDRRGPRQRFREGGGGHEAIHIPGPGHAARRR